MPSLLEQLPKIVADGKREAVRIMERLESSYRIGFQTRELVIPSRDTEWQDMLVKRATFRPNMPAFSGDRQVAELARDGTGNVTNYLVDLAARRLWIRSRAPLTCSRIVSRSGFTPACCMEEACVVGREGLVPALVIPRAA